MCPGWGMTPTEPVEERTLYVLSFMSVVLVRELSPECPWESFHSGWGLEKSWTNCSHHCFLPLPWLPEVCCVKTVTSLTEPWHLPSLAKSLWDKERKGRGRWEEVVGILTRSSQSPPLDSNLAFGPEKFSIYVKEPDILWIRFGGPTEYFHCARHCA